MQLKIKEPYLNAKYVLLLRTVAIPASFKICEADKGIKGESFGRDNFGIEVGARYKIVV